MCFSHSRFLPRHYPGFRTASSESNLEVASLPMASRKDKEEDWASEEADFGIQAFEIPSIESLLISTESPLNLPPPGFPVCRFSFDI
jgi:hypothetical protein